MLAAEIPKGAELVEHDAVDPVPDPVPAPLREAPVDGLHLAATPTGLRAVLTDGPTPAMRNDLFGDLPGVLEISRGRPACAATVRGRDIG